MHGLLKIICKVGYFILFYQFIWRLTTARFLSNRLCREENTHILLTTLEYEQVVFSSWIWRAVEKNRKSRRTENGAKKKRGERERASNFLSLALFSCFLLPQSPRAGIAILFRGSTNFSQFSRNYPVCLLRTGKTPGQVGCSNIYYFDADFE